MRTNRFNGLVVNTVEPFIVQWSAALHDVAPGQYHSHALILEVYVPLTAVTNLTYLIMGK